MVAAVKGYKLVLVMPESMSIERRRLMLAYRRDLRPHPREKGMKGAIDRAQEMLDETPGAWMPQQFENPANIEVHVRTTAQEILADFRDAPIDALITGVGTGGHITALRRGAEEGMARAQGVRGRADAVAGHLGRPARPAPDPGHRRRLHPGQPPHRRRSTA